MATPQITKIETSYAEAPASWNTRYITPAGFVCQITLRGESGKDLLEKTSVALNWLLENNFLPCENTYKPKFNGKKSDSNNSKSNIQSGDPSDPAASTCPIHNCEMRRFEKNGRAWFSHKTDDGSWCNGKSK